MRGDPALRGGEGVSHASQCTIWRLGGCPNRMVNFWCRKALDQPRTGPLCFEIMQGERVEID